MGCNSQSIVKAINSGMFLIIIFSGISLSVPISTNMEGTTERGYIPVIISVLVYIYYLKQSYNNYFGFFLDKKEARYLYNRDMIFASIGYMICFLSSFFSFDSNLYSYIF